MTDELVLLPVPRQLESGPDGYALAGGRRIVLAGAPAEELLFAGQRLQAALRAHAQVDWSLAAASAGDPAEIGAVLAVDPARADQPEAYTLEIGAGGIRATAGTPQGIFYAVATLAQILSQRGARLPGLRVDDRPDFAQRGVMLDISRDKVPTQATLYDLVELLASWKVNQLQLYMEHTFSYRAHPEVWRHASPLTEQDILELDAFCRARHIELVPNQNSFGHLHRWLTLARYRDLAEAPDGCDSEEWGRMEEPFSLNPTDPRALDFLRSLYDELLPHFSSRQFNAGCDETYDLGRGRSRAEAERRGVGALYLDFLTAIHAEVTARGRRMQFWGDFILRYPELLAQLPPGVIALEWGYEADHAFEAHAAQWAGAGIPFYVCPGTSTWSLALGRTDNLIANQVSAAESGLRHGAIGYLNTDWGDNGHWQYLPLSYMGFACGAALSWGLEANRERDLPAALDRFAFHDRAGVLGRLAYELGLVTRPLGRGYRAAFQLVMLRTLEQVRASPHGSAEGFAQVVAAIDAAIAPLGQAQPEHPLGALIVDELATAARTARHAARRGLLAYEDDPARAAALRRELDADIVAIMAAHERLWHARNRPGGFRDSVARMAGVRGEYGGGTPGGTTDAHR